MTTPKPKNYANQKVEVAPRVFTIPTDLGSRLLKLIDDNEQWHTRWREFDAWKASIDKWVNDAKEREAHYKSTAQDIKEIVNQSRLDAANDRKIIKALVVSFGGLVGAIEGVRGLWTFLEWVGIIK